MISRPSSVSCCGEEHCITCADEGIPMEVVEIDPRRGLALCADAHGAHSTVEIALVGPVGRGDRLLVHAGTAIASLPGSLEESPA